MSVFVQHLGGGRALQFLMEANGGGGGGQGDSVPGVFDSYLESVPEDGREAVAAYLKDAEKTVNGRLSEAAALRENWGGYEEHLADYREKYKPEELAQVLAWHQQVSQDDNAYQTWLTEAAKQAGLIAGDAPPVEEGDVSREDIAKLIDEQVQARTAPVQERLEAWEYDRQVQETEQTTRDGLDALEAEHKVELSQKQRALVMELGMEHAGEDWLKVGFGRLQQIVADSQHTFVANAQAQPGSPIKGGGAPPAVKSPATFEDAGKIARERLRAANQQ